MCIKKQIRYFHKRLTSTGTQLIAVSKRKSLKKIIDAYDAGQLDFGENQVQELLKKREEIPTDIRKKIRWHLIGHLQRNKVKAVLPHVHLIHSVDSLRLLLEIEKHAKVINKEIEVLLQIHIADEKEKYGFSYKEIDNFLKEKEISNCTHVKVIGLMGIATNTDDKQQIEREYKKLKLFYDALDKRELPKNFCMRVLSIGMSADYQIALKFNPTYVRIGSEIFGSRISSMNT